MKEKILIVEDEFIVANDLRIILEKAGYTVCGIAPSVVKAVDLIAAKQPDWILLDIFLQGDLTGIELAAQLKQADIPFIYISANTNQATLEAAKATLPYGFLVKPFREKDLLVMLDIARYRHGQHQKYKQEEQLSLQQQIAQIMVKKEAPADQVKQVFTLINTAVPFDFVWMISTRQKTRELGLLRISDDGYQLFHQPELLEAMSVSQRDFKSWNAQTVLTNTKSIYNSYDFKKLKMDNIWVKSIADHYQLESLLVEEINCKDGTDQFLFFYRAAELYNPAHTQMLKGVKESLKHLLDLMMDSKTLPAEKQHTSVERPRASAADFSGVIGNSHLLHAIFKKIALVAPDDTSVLILGESGTGKERIAYAIHKLSPRKSRQMVIVNCAALPITLIESELFGHEKGAFTGANEKRIGKFEQADGGTIFLDEIGELPLEAQVKLLRVLQEKEIERVGSNYTKKINVRIIAATNRNLEKEVAEGRFRLDLYYRLNVFPVELPALRHRKEDISLLVQHFIQKYSKGSNAGITGISQQALDELTSYHWPGNIRELEHLIERSMVMTEGDTITAVELPSAGILTENTGAASFRIKTMEEMEREHILSTLKICKGKIFGAGGAAELLNIPSTTLNSKIKKLGIKYGFEK